MLDRFGSAGVGRGRIVLAAALALLTLGPISAPFAAAAVWNYRQGRRWRAALWSCGLVSVYLLTPLATTALLSFDARALGHLN